MKLQSVLISCLTLWCFSAAAHDVFIPKKVLRQDLNALKRHWEDDGQKLLSFARTAYDDFEGIAQFIILVDDGTAGGACFEVSVLNDGHRAIPLDLRNKKLSDCAAIRPEFSL